jgi:L-alanine-DL-glutamate epimerase-like enolase superfamily enzyme
MSGKLTITGVEIHEFEHEVRDLGTPPRWEPGRVRAGRKCAVRVHTDAGISGENVTYVDLEAGGARMVAQSLIGRDALERESIYQDVKRALRQVARIGLASIDNCLWDIAGQYHNAPIWRLLGGYRTRLPVYASTFLGDDEPGGLNSPEAFADFAEQCLELGYRAFKLHTWWRGPIAREVELVRAVGKRVGGKMALMLDPASAYETLADAVVVGRACDEYNYFWYEDPFQDTGVAHYAHRKLRQLIRTPILQAEHVRGLEDRVNFLTADATDFIRGDVEYDGITASMKLAHAAEALGVDVEYHIGGPTTMHCLAAVRNSNFLEWGLVHPRANWESTPWYLDGDQGHQLDGVDADGCVAVPNGPGVGVRLHWEFIRAHSTGSAVFE